MVLCRESRYFSSESRHFSRISLFLKRNSLFLYGRLGGTTITMVSRRSLE